MLQISVTRRHLMVFVAVVAVVVSVAWVGVAQRASAASATPVAYVATGENFPDALGAAAAAAVQGGPVLLVTKNSIPAVTAAELTRLGPDVIYVSGGTAVVSDAVFDALKAYAPSVIRAAGANRYSTAVEVSKSAFPVTGGENAALQAQVAALSAEVDALQALLAGVSRNGDTLLLTGMNLQVVNGQGSTATSNKLGNVIIGYNETDPSAARGSRNGSHYLVVGDEHSYTIYAGIVTGKHNKSTAAYASVTGGSFSIASGDHASVSGGFDSTASDPYASVSGGYGNTADGDHASVSGGDGNTASGANSSILGGSGEAVGIMNATYPSCGC